MSRMRFLMSMGAGCFAAGAHGAFVAYVSEDAWKADVPVVTTIQFSEVPLYSHLTTQYAPLGVTFTPGDDWTDSNANLWPSDGIGVRGGITGLGVPLPIVMIFSEPINAVAIRFPASTKFFLYSGDTLVAQSGSFLGFDPWSFAGIISDTAFDKVVINNTSGVINTADTLFFGTPIPAPGAAFVLGMGAIGFGRRRR